MILMTFLYYNYFVSLGHKILYKYKTSYFLLCT